MCGICGIVNNDSSVPINEAILRQMNAVITHRGPDDEGYYIAGNVGLGMRRLSIIDLVTGHQPICNEDQTVWVVFNGEIYNFPSIQAELIQKGHRFATQSDTEVIVHAYEEYGTSCVERFNGMFAFALWDSKQQRLFIARDHLGIKPLYYWCRNGELVFGSELKCVIKNPDIPREIDLEALDQFLSLEYIPTPRTIFQGITKLPAGHRLIYEKGNLTIERYWDIPFKPVLGDINTCAETLKELIDDAVRLQLISDVPLGAFLSGGIDSSTVVAAMSRVSQIPVRTFSIGFDDATYNEMPYARLVAKQYNTQHTEEILTPDIGEIAQNLVLHLDEPFADFSIFPTFLVSEVARRSVKVVLSGDGGDELFGGYDTYVAQSWDRYYRWLPDRLRMQSIPRLLAHVPPQPAKKGLVNKVKRFVEGAALPAELQHTRWMLFMTPADKSSLYQPEVGSCLDGRSTESVLINYFKLAAERDSLAQQQYVDIKTYLVDDILTKVDRMSMAVSLETRVPLLDYRLVELAVNLPPEMKIGQGQTKRILRHAMADRLPAEVLNKPKQGFSIPLKNWLRGPLKPMMLDLLSPESINKQGLFNPACVTQWVDEHLEGKVNHSHRLWALMVFMLWQNYAWDTSQSTKSR